MLRELFSSIIAPIAVGVVLTIFGNWYNRRH